ncbi:MULTISPECIES: hypothetical protein [unclassified Corynebacterium]|uniref:hypothetical protein n=1 Tax=unclassified Corynebacterium TaxID=2624378 RepID=UPI0029CA4613|nr:MULTISPECIES: hypothetical protein [unclassified Corynebacterium]WPF66197.1 hypothetical protein OLX12_00215 [Corynebacterium sp. 22KM0430]WPF68688.1 hypothetical protein OLW90_00215 [Corynebacterium sp. 21KM1197]
MKNGTFALATAIVAGICLTGCGTDPAVAPAPSESASATAITPAPDGADATEPYQNGQDGADATEPGQSPGSGGDGMNGGDGGNGYGWDPSTLSPEERHEYELHERLKNANTTTMSPEEQEELERDAQQYAVDKIREYTQ